MESADSLSARLLELLGSFGEAKAWAAAVEGHASISVDVIRQLAHRVERLEEILEVYRDQKAPDRRGFDALQRRLMDQGIEAEMKWQVGQAQRQNGDVGSLAQCGKGGGRQRQGSERADRKDEPGDEPGTALQCQAEYGKHQP